MNRLTRCLILAATGVAMVVLTLPVSAQDGGRGDRFRGRGGRGGPGGMWRMMEPEFLRRDLPLFVSELDLDRSQAVVVETLLIDYQTAFDEAGEALRGRFEEMRPRDEQSEERRARREQLFEEMRSVRAEVRALREQAGEDGEIDPAAMEKVRERMEAFREQMRELRPPREGPEFQAMMANISHISGDWGRERDGLRADFLNDLMAILSEPQTESWPAFDRTLRRVKTLNRGRYAGESVDLLRIVRDIGVGEDERFLLEDTLEAYAIDLDRALVERNEELDAARQQRLEAMSLGDTDRVKALIAGETDKRLAVRGVNERYRDEIAARLADEMPGDLAAAFREEYDLRAYPRIFRASRMARSFDAVREMEGLDEETREAIGLLEVAYVSEVGPANRRLVSLTRSEEPKQSVARMSRWIDRMNGVEAERPADPLREAFDERTKMEIRYREQLEAMLTEEQIAELPPPPREREGRGGPWGEGGWGRWGRGGRGGDDGEGRRRMMMERFDRDGDGELSETERQAAREAREQRRRERDGGEE
ncbi:MAG: hypothetical protein ACYTG1_08615 [Planctomycetota bacterium]|jgi:hypothetical protein